MRVVRIRKAGWMHDAALDDEVGPPSDPESDDGGSDFVDDDVSDDDE